MKTNVIRIGNSRGIRIPKRLLEECRLEETVELEAHKDHLVVRSATKPRGGWEEAFRRMAKRATISSWTETYWSRQGGIKPSGSGSLALRGLPRPPEPDRRPGNSQDPPVPDHLSRRDEPLHRHRHHCSNDTRGRPYPTRIPVRFQRKNGQIVLDQIRTVDKTRLVKRLGKIDEAIAQKVLAVLNEMFAA